MREFIFQLIRLICEAIICKIRDIEYKESIITIPVSELNKVVIYPYPNEVCTRVIYKGVKYKGKPHLFDFSYDIKDTVYYSEGRPCDVTKICNSLRAKIVLRKRVSLRKFGLINEIITVEPCNCITVTKTQVSCGKIKERIKEHFAAFTMTPIRWVKLVCSLVCSIVTIYMTVSFYQYTQKEEIITVSASECKIGHSLIHSEALYNGEAYCSSNSLFSEVVDAMILKGTFGISTIKTTIKKITLGKKGFDRMILAAEYEVTSTITGKTETIFNIRKNLSDDVKSRILQDYNKQM